MICLTIRQPWAWMILNVGKDIENRTWANKYRGPILIHAAKGCTKAEYEQACRDAYPMFSTDYHGIAIPPLESLDRGGIVGKVDIIGCLKESPSNWFHGPYGFLLDQPQTMDFYPCRGQLGFWKLERPS